MPTIKTVLHTSEKKCFVHILEKYLRSLYSEKSIAEGRDRSGKWKQHKKETNPSRKL